MSFLLANLTTYPSTLATELIMTLTMK